MGGPGTRGSPYVLTVRDLAKTYYYGKHPVPALNGVSFELRRGEFMGVFGPNGAGKTTTTKIIVGLLDPTSGSVSVDGLDAGRGTAARTRIGYVPQQGSLLASLTTAEELVFHARSFGLSKARARERAAEAARLLGVADLMDRDVLRLSGGQRRRIEIALALVHEPDVLVLDEPTLGLDPHTRSALWEVIRRLRAELGTTVLMTTHYLDEASALMDRVVIMDFGRVVAAGTPAEIIAANATGVLTLGPFDATDKVARILRGDPAFAAAEVEADGDGYVRVRCADTDHVLPAGIATLYANGITVTEARAAPATISDAFFAITGRRLAT